MMTGFKASLPPRALSPARRRMHRAVQWLARTARSYLPPQADDGHTALVWSDAPVSSLADDEAEAAPHIALGADIPVEIAIVAPALTMRYAPGLHQLWFGNPARPNNVFNLAGRSDAEQAHDLPLALKSLGADPARFRVDLPYTDEIPEDAEAGAEATAELCRYYSMFARLLSELPRGGPVRLGPVRLGPVRLGPVRLGPVRLWPHHFDIARLIELGGGRTVGVGLAPDDSYYDQPYLYVSPWPATAIRDFPDPPAGLRWRREGFTALVATAEELMLADGAEARVSAAIKEAVALCERALA